MKLRVWLTLVFLLGWVSGVVAQSTPLVSRVAVGGDLLKLDWRVYVAAKPVYCILVEKDRQLVRVLRHDGRVQVVAEYIAGTGENLGRKEVEGDAKTPEGVYLIAKSYVDRKMSVFGTRAFHLNYPNYFDIQDGRTGSGIFIHGTNRPLRLSSSNGCVTLDNDDLANLAGFLDINTPIFIVPSLAELHDAAEYPNLTDKDFSGAKALLVPEGGDQVDFASLYLININDQIVVVGEYWPGQGSDVALQKAIAYIQRTQDGRWFVADRGPTGEALSVDAVMTIAGRAVWPEEHGGTGPDEIAIIAGAEETGIWESSLADVYLTWRQETARTQQEFFSATIQQELLAGSVTTINRDGLIYGLFLLATIISICSAAIMLRRQDHSGRLGVANIESEGDATPCGNGVDQTAMLSDEVKQAMGMLRSVRDQIEEEARRMERHEALESRLGSLEQDFHSGQATIAELVAGQSTVMQERDYDREDREEMIGALRLDVAEVKRQWDAAHSDIAASNVRIGEVHEQLVEITELLVEQRGALQIGRQESNDVLVVCDQLRSRIDDMAEAVESNVSRAFQGDAKEEPTEEMLAVLNAYAGELATMREQISSLRLEPDTKVLEEVLQGLRRDNERREAGEAEIKELRSILEVLHSGMLSDQTETAFLVSELAAREEEIGSLHAASERERSESGSVVSSLQAALREIEARAKALQQEKEALQ
ncbi:MAG: L,D-transpeptidase family protein, partial [Proteobacteria bacterium]|nr:L,D-transpeptidase family protein [Pseudomonadota bacterium]